jgi:hypothetical protein
MARAAAHCGEKRKVGREGFRHLPLHPLFYFHPLCHSPPKFRAPPPAGKQVSGTQISGRRWRRILHLGFIFFLVQHFFISDDDGKESLTPVSRLWLDLG